MNTRVILSTWTLLIAFTLCSIFAQSDTTDVVSGNIPTDCYRPLPSNTASLWLRSILSPATSVATSRLRLLNARLPVDSSREMLLRFVLLDTNGNALIGLPPNEFRYKIQIVNTEGWHYAETFVPTFNHDACISRRLRLAFCIDASVNNILHRSMISAAIGSIPIALSPFDSIAWIIPQATPIVALPMTHSSALSTLSTYFDQHCQFKGLNRLYYAILWTLRALQPTAVIVISGSDDHASYDVHVNDLIHTAQLLKVPVHCVTIGENLDTAPWEALSAFSGGNFYRLYSTDDPKLLSDALTEIIRTEQVSTIAQFQLPPDAAFHIANGCSVQLLCSSANAMMIDSLDVPPQRALNPPRQLIALFDHESQAVDSLYLPLIVALAELLKANPTQRIELVGHAYAEGDPSAMQFLSADRVRSISHALIAHGVQPSQLRLRAMGSLKPIYPNARTSAEFVINRRVEFRWLDPSLLPYELVVAYTYQESQALREVELWENRGYRAYMETVMLPDGAAFRVKLWGYATEAEARKAAMTIMRYYRTKASIE